MPIPVASVMIENKREVSNDTAYKPTNSSVFSSGVGVTTIRLCGFIGILLHILHYIDRHCEEHGNR
jgi:hypothetical protein